MQRNRKTTRRMAALFASMVLAVCCFCSCSYEEQPSEPVTATFEGVTFTTPAGFTMLEEGDSSAYGKDHYKDKYKEEEPGILHLDFVRKDKNGLNWLNCETYTEEYPFVDIVVEEFELEMETLNETNGREVIWDYSSSTEEYDTIGTVTWFSYCTHYNENGACVYDWVICTVNGKTYAFYSERAVKDREDEETVAECHKLNREDVRTVLESLHAAE